MATRIATHTQLLDETHAMLVDPTPQGLAEGLRAVLANPLLARERARAGQRLVEREFGPDRFREKVARLYAHVSAAVAARRAAAGSRAG